MAAACGRQGYVQAGAQAATQTGSGQRAQTSEEAFKNIQVLKGITVNEFMGTMGVFSLALGMSCEDCHKADDTDWANFAIDNPRKRMARAMVTMMANINKTNHDLLSITRLVSVFETFDSEEAAVQSYPAAVRA